MTKKMLLRIGLITGFVAAVYPIAALLCFSENCGNASSLLLLGTWILAAWLGIWEMLLLFRQYHKRSKLVLTLFLLEAMGLLVGGYLVVPLQATWICGCYGLCLGGSFFAGTRLILQPLENLSHAYTLTAIFVIDVLLGVACRLYNAEISLLPLIFVLLGNLLLFALAHNDTALKQILYDRGDTPWELPRAVHQRNVRLMSIFCGLGVLILLLFPLVAKFLRWICRWIYVAFWYLLRWLFASGSGSEEETVLPEAISEQVTTVQQNSTVDWIWMTLEIVVLIGLLLLAFWKRRSIWRALQELFQNLRQWVHRILEKTPEMPPEETGAYCDYVEDLTIRDVERSTNFSGMTCHRWNQFYRQFLRMPKNEACYRLGYALVLEKLPKEVVYPAASTGEILAQLQVMGKTSDSMTRATKLYEAVRYGEIVPQEQDFSDLQAILAAIKKQKIKSTG